MLSTISCSKDHKYSFYVQTEVWDELDLVITNGQTVWINNDEINERKVTYECRPNSRKKESKISYLNALKAALIVDPAVIALDLPTRIKYTYEVVISSDESLSLTIKEQLPDTTLLTILYKGSFSPKPNPVSSIMELLETFGNIIHSKSKSIQELESKTQELNQLIEKNVLTIQELNDCKETLQTSMIQKMCVVLNTKKREIQQLRESQGKNDNQHKSTLHDDHDENTHQEVEEVAPVKATTARGRKTVAKKKEPASKSNTKKATASRKSNLDKIQANVKAGKRSSKRKIDSDEEEEANFDEDDDEDDEHSMEVDNVLYDSEEVEEDNDIPRPSKRTRKGRTVEEKDHNDDLPPASTSSAKGIDFDRIRQLAQEFDLKKASTNESDESPRPLLSNPRAKEVHSSQISDFLSSQAEEKNSSSNNSSGGLFGKPLALEDDDSGREDDDGPPVPSASKSSAPEPPRRIFQGFADQNKKSKSRRLLDDSDED